MCGNMDVSDVSRAVAVMENIYQFYLGDNKSVLVQLSWCLTLNWPCTSPLCELWGIYPDYFGKKAAQIVHNG